MFHSEQFFCCRKGIFNIFLKELDNKLDTKLDFQWTELGIQTLKKYLKNMM